MSFMNTQTIYNELLKSLPTENYSGEVTINVCDIEMCFNVNYTYSYTYKCEQQSLNVNGVSFYDNEGDTLSIDLNINELEMMFSFYQQSKNC